MLAESFVSAALLVAVFLPVLLAIPGSITALAQLCTALGRHPLYSSLVFALYLVGCYGKDFGKFWFTRNGSSMHAKIIALLYPFGTWGFELLLYYGLGGQHAEPEQGVPWTRASWLNLLGFSVVLVGTAGYLLASKKEKKKGSRWDFLKDFIGAREGPPRR